MKTVYAVKLENGNFAKMEHEVGTHVRVEEVTDLSEATHFDIENDAKHYFDDFNLFKKHGFGYEKINNSMYQYHGDFSNFKEIKEVQITYQIIDNKVKEELQDKHNVIHDCFYSFTGNVPTEKIINEISDKLPENIKLLAKQWGWSDTEVREFTYCFIKDALSKDEITICEHNFEKVSVDRFQLNLCTLCGKNKES